MSWFSVDVESDGPAPGPDLYSMTVIGACLVKDPNQGFLGYLRPISENWIPEAQAISGFTREEALEFPDPRTTMAAFSAWVKETNEPGTHPVFTSDNNGYDWMFTCWYLWQFTGDNPFGFSSKNINNLWQGMQRDAFASPRHLAITKHDHNPLHDARGHAEALAQMIDNFELKVKNL